MLIQQIDPEKYHFDQIKMQKILSYELLPANKTDQAAKNVQLTMFLLSFQLCRRMARMYVKLTQPFY